MRCPFAYTQRWSPCSPFGVIALEIVFGCDKWTPWKPLPERTEAMINALGYGLFAEKH